MAKAKPIKILDIPPTCSLITARRMAGGGFLDSPELISIIRAGIRAARRRKASLERLRFFIDTENGKWRYFISKLKHGQDRYK